MSSPNPSAAQARPSGPISFACTLPEYVADTGALLQKLVERSQSPILLDARRPFRQPGQSEGEIVVVLSGIVSIFRTDWAGRRQVVALRYPGEAIFPHEVGASFGIQAIVVSNVSVARAAELAKCVANCPASQKLIWRMMQRNQAIAYEWMVTCGIRETSSRVAHLLCETIQRLGIDPSSQMLANPFTQQQVADITGQTSVNVSRVFVHLERSGLIARRGREIQVTDWDELKRVAGFNPAYLA